jgi:hypothetical protein
MGAFLLRSERPLFAIDEPIPHCARPLAIQDIEHAVEQRGRKQQIEQAIQNHLHPFPGHASFTSSFHRSIISFRHCRGQFHAEESFPLSTDKSADFIPYPQYFL